jgi:queuine tRNA-ribosyltransferase
VSLVLEVAATDGPARVATATTARGTFTTPCFMPVGTRGTVKGLAAPDLEALGAEVVLANALHLALRPGAATVAALGGLHRFSGWSGHVLTDSGGYQVFSLRPEVDDDGVTFRSPYDGTPTRLTPEGVVDLQGTLGSDLAMALDECPPLPSPPAVIRRAVERTLAWAARSRRAPRREGQALLGIVQGGTDLVLRAECATRVVELGFDGYAVGGLSVGEPRPAMLETLAATLEHLPADRPRYLMGVGDPVGLVEAIALGVDLFDCVLPTRLARNGALFTPTGRISIKQRRFADVHEPLDPECDCDACTQFSAAYLHHLFRSGEILGLRLASVHNLRFLANQVEAIRQAIEQNGFVSAYASFLSRYRPVGHALIV